MMARRTNGLSRLAGTLAIGFTLATGAWATDVDELVDTCSHCHERDGASNDPNMPIIGGYSQAYLISSLYAYKQKTRPCPEYEYMYVENEVKKTDMCRVTEVLSDEDVKKLGEYYAAQKFRRANQDFDPELAKKGERIHMFNCEKCHDEGGSVADDDAGILAGQWTPYLKQQFFDFYTEKRLLAKKMKPKFNKLGKEDIEQLLNYYASFH
jgi:sulfide dehydrogenase cytochrome subunit